MDNNQLLNKPLSRSFKYAENNPEYKGKPLDQNLRYGVIENRSCTDFLCCLLFVMLWIGMILSASIGFKNGNPKKMLSPFDSAGNQCGLTKGFEQYNKIYFPQPNNISKTVCVKQCPTSENQTSVDCKFNKYVTNCNKSKEFEIYPTDTIVILCFPTLDQQIDQLQDKLQIDHLTKYLNDIRNSWAIILGSAFIAFIFGFLLMWFMQYAVKLLIWLEIILIFLGLVALSAFFVYRSTLLKESHSKNGMLAGGVVLAILALLYLALVCCIQKKIKICCEVMAQTADYITDVPRIMLIPFMVFFYSLIFMSFWLVSTVYIHTQGVQRQFNNTFLSRIKYTDTITWQMVYQFVCVIWNIEFVIALGYFILASSAAIWYFTEGEGINSKDVQQPLRKSFHKVFRYHLGSIAYGSLILTFVWIIKAIMTFIHDQIKDKTGFEGANFCLKCCNCYLDCFERFIRFLTQNSYIVMAITGKSFCESAYDSFYMIVKNPIRFAALKWIGTMFLFFGQLFIMTATTLSCYLIITKVKHYQQNLFSPLAPSILFGVISYMVSSIFMGVHGISADTILCAYCIDEEINSRPKYCPPKLNNFFSQNGL